MKSLDILFGGQGRTRLIRTFLLNPEQVFDIELICQKTKIDKKEADKVTSELQKGGFLIKGFFYKVIEKKNRGKVIEQKKKATGYSLNNSFPYLIDLKTLLVSPVILESADILRKLGKATRLKLVLVSGIFTQDAESRADILIVGEKAKKNAVDKVIKSLEAEFGKELNYAYFDFEDYLYRIEMNDRLVRDILDYPHKVLIDKTSK